ncbi:MAG TPA: ABC transporter substrate-binding protein [Actinomycetota bacterium]|nr:ABC transporter substrate-binding protein [Actinomycetota bacterium]
MGEEERSGSLFDERLSRRTFLKGAGIGALGLGASQILAACSSIKGSGTSTGDTITIGMVIPQTGALAGFASGDQFVVNRIRQTSQYKNGFKVGGKTYKVNIVVKDSQSDPNRASEVARDLVNQNHADLVVTTSTPETTNPVAEICESNKTPCVSTVVPWEAWYFARQADPKNPKPFKYTTMYFFGVDQFGGCFVPMWNAVPTNKVVGGMFPNDADGNAFRSAWPDIIDKAGYTWVDGGAYPDGTTDFSSMISKFKSKDCEIFINAPLPPDFNTFWKQAAQQGYKPKLATVAKVLLFPADTDALGDLVNNIATDSWWGPYMPNKSSLTGETAEDLANAYQSSSGKQWLQTLGSTYSLFEVAHQALTGVDDPHDHDAVAAQLQGLSYTGMSGPLDFTKGPVPGVAIMQPVGVQWQKGKQFPYEMVVVDNSLNPDVQLGGTLQPTNA